MGDESAIKWLGPVFVSREFYLTEGFNTVYGEKCWRIEQFDQNAGKMEPVNSYIYEDLEEAKTETILKSTESMVRRIVEDAYYRILRAIIDPKEGMKDVLKSYVSGGSDGQGDPDPSSEDN